MCPARGSPSEGYHEPGVSIAEDASPKCMSQMPDACIEPVAGVAREKRSIQLLSKKDRFHGSKINAFLQQLVALMKYIACLNVG